MAPGERRSGNRCRRCECGPPQLRDALRDDPASDALEPASPLPSSGDPVRTGDGIPIEDLGIPGIPYEMTKNDLMHSNKDLLAFCTRLLNDVGQ